MVLGERPLAPVGGRSRAIRLDEADGFTLPPASAPSRAGAAILPQWLIATERGGGFLPRLFSFVFHDDGRGQRRRRPDRNARAAPSSQSIHRQINKKPTCFDIRCRSPQLIKSIINKY